MALAHDLEEAGLDPEEIATTACISIEQIDKRDKITKILLETQGAVPAIDPQAFPEYAETAKKTCPVYQALAGAKTDLKAILQTSPRQGKRYGCGGVTQKVGMAAQDKMCRSANKGRWSEATRAR
jgi:hypothetical protein